MRATSVPQALRERLGHDAAIGLIEFVESKDHEWSEHVLNSAVDRFERRLTEQVADLKVALVREIHETRSEAIKWAFLFWATQLTAFAGVLFLVLKNSPR